MVLNAALFFAFIKPVDTLYNPIKKTASTSYPELIAEAEKITKSKGAKAAWNAFYNENAGSTDFGMHDVAHYIGNLLYEDEGVEGLLLCTTDFAFGCYHGLLERFIEREGTGNFAKVVTLCKTLDYQIEITCYHGMGHGLLTHFSYRIEDALRLCDSVLEDKDHFYCYKGVFMENANEKAQDIKQKDPLWPCTTIEEGYKQACFEYQSTLLARYFDNDIQQMGAACEKAGSDFLSRRCILGIGQQIGQRSADKIDTIIPMCKTIENSVYAYECISAAAEEYVFQKQPFENAQKLCLSLPDWYQEDCQKRIQTQKDILI